MYLHFTYYVYYLPILIDMPTVKYILFDIKLEILEGRAQNIFRKYIKCIYRRSY